MNILTITTLYPNKKQFRHGVFIETRLRRLLETKKIQAKVIAPVPWFPFKSERFKKYAVYADIPKIEHRHGIDIYHPRYLVIPKIGMLLTPFFMAIPLYLQIRQLQKQQPIDLIDAHYFYPDGVAVALANKLLNIPFIISARGTDINLIPEHALPRQMILWAAKQAKASVTVCKALKDSMIEMGADASKIHVYRNGVDLELFKLLDKSQCRENYQLNKKTLVSVGHLVERKGHHLIIQAMQLLPDYQLLIVGGGEEESALKGLVEKLNLAEQVCFLGEKQQQELTTIYNAADAMILASSREGWANVLLESMACGTPVVATDIWGTPEVVQNADAGVLVKRTPEAIAEGVKALFDHYPTRKNTRKYAEQFSWDSTTQGLLKLFSAVKTSLPPLKNGG